MLPAQEIEAYQQVAQLSLPAPPPTPFLTVLYHLSLILTLVQSFVPCGLSPLQLRAASYILQPPTASQLSSSEGRLPCGV